MKRKDIKQRSISLLYSYLDELAIIVYLPTTAEKISGLAALIVEMNKFPIPRTSTPDFSRVVARKMVEIARNILYMGVYGAKMNEVLKNASSYIVAALNLLED